MVDLREIIHVYFNTYAHTYMHWDLVFLKCCIVFILIHKIIFVNVSPISKEMYNTITDDY